MLLKNGAVLCQGACRWGFSVHTAAAAAAEAPSEQARDATALHGAVEGVADERGRGQGEPECLLRAPRAELESREHLKRRQRQTQRRPWQRQQQKQQRRRRRRRRRR